MGNSVSSPGGKVAIACGAAALAWGASYLRDFVSNDEDLSSKSTKKSSASASSTRDVPASDRNELAEEALTDPQNSYGYANGSEVLSINSTEVLSFISTKQSSAAASSTRDAPASDRNELAEEALTDPLNSYGYANGNEVLSINSTEVLSFISTKQSSASASSTRDAPASDRNKLAEEVLTDLLNSYGYANGNEEVLSFGSTKQSSASASSTRDAPASDRNKLAKGASVTRRSETPRRISRNPMPRVITIVTYNIWQVDVKLNERMEAIGVLMQLKMPDIILFQEVTPKIHKIFEEFEWWRRYECVPHKTPTRKHYCMLLSRVPVKVLCLKRFKDSIMKKKLIVAEVEAFGERRRLVVANSHLKKPDLPDESHTKKRTAQAKEAITILTNYENVIFGGDMNWSEELDGRFPLPKGKGWVDAWKHLKPRKKGWTYDTVSNLMITGRRRLQERLDRFLCKLKDYKLAYIKIIGKDSIPGLMHQHNDKDYPVLCSDHFGLLLGISI
ncbi:uncharacterized protein LOC141842167 isoform X2 [Curcuma longa]|uniref:uncharacterized protein LOC141842167 isoform X2 n=1 Tax=Curcuma longa TaxID=136217 RepID=UPI003D9E7E3D